MSALTDFDTVCLYLHQQRTKYRRNLSLGPLFLSGFILFCAILPALCLNLRILALKCSKILLVLALPRLEGSIIQDLIESEMRLFPTICILFININLINYMTLCCDCSLCNSLPQQEHL
jgi:hypothetical protein